MFPEYSDAFVNSRNFFGKLKGKYYSAFRSVLSLTAKMDSCELGTLSLSLSSLCKSADFGDMRMGASCSPFTHSLNRPPTAGMRKGSSSSSSGQQTKKQKVSLLWKLRVVPSFVVW